jgi:N-acetyl-anhydromuramyl-L-alanine amidase AmpD
MAADWYYIEEGKSVGPVSTEEIIGRIRKAKDQPLFVWTAGMSEWTDAHTIAQFSAGFQMEEPAQPHPEKGYVEAQQPATGGHATSEWTDAHRQNAADPRPRRGAAPW